MKKLIIGDIHFRDNLGYSDHIKDGRLAEREEVKDFIIESSKDCDEIIIIGDMLNGRNNSSAIIKEAVSFLKKLGEKQIYILGGNHEKKADGTSALDFLQKVDMPNWKVITDKIEEHNGMVFSPYFYRQELEAKTNDEATDKLLEMLSVVKNLGSDKNNILFCHQAISGTQVTKNVSTDLFNEIILPKAKLHEIFDFVCGGHIHKPSIEMDGKTVVTGSVFNNEVGETGKYIWKLDDDMSVEQIRLPGREVHKLENPTIDDINKIKEDSIVKVVLTNPDFEGAVAASIRLLAKNRFDAHVVIERYPHKREQINFDDGMLDFDIENLLEVYAKERKVDVKKLKAAYNIIK